MTRAGALIVRNRGPKIPVPQRGHAGSSHLIHGAQGVECVSKEISPRSFETRREHHIELQHREKRVAADMASRLPRRSRTAAGARLCKEASTSRWTASNTKASCP